MGTFLEPSYLLFAVLTWVGMGALTYALTRMLIKRQELPITSGSVVSNINERTNTAGIILGATIWFMLIPSLEGSGPAAITLEGYVGFFVSCIINYITGSMAFKLEELQIPERTWSEREGEPYRW